MTRKMIEIEYERTGKGEIFISNGSGEIPTPTGKKIILHEHKRRKRRAPCAVEKLREILSHECYSRKFTDDYNDYGLKGRGEIMILLPPATIIRERELIIEYGEWSEK